MAAIELLEPLVDPASGLGVDEATISARGFGHSTFDTR
jgi:hypothetical protein